MALRPVSELGLVDVTDIAGPEKGKKSTPPADKRSRPAERRRPAATTPPPRRSARPKRSAASATAKPPQRRTQGAETISRSSVSAGLATPLLSSAIGLAGSFLLARAVLHRGRG